jgi:branched-chain amino acid transport system permease protein
VTKSLWWMFGSIALVVIGLPWLLSPSQVELLGVIGIIAIVGLSLLLLTGWAGQISLGQFAFSAIGAYVAAVVQLPFLLSLLLGALAGAVAAVIVGIPALKLRGLHLAVMTLALALAVYAVLLDPTHLGSALPPSLSRPAFLGVSAASQHVFYYLVVVFLALVVVAVVGLRRSRIGRVLIAARDNDRATQSFGINLTQARLTAFAVSGFLAALAGGLYAYQQQGVAQSDYLPQQSINVFLYTVIGGLGAVSGPIIGAVVYGLTILFGAKPWMTELLTGLGGLLLLLAFPGGLGRMVFEIRDAILRRVADRHRILVPSLLSDRRPGAYDRLIQLMPKRNPKGGAVFIPERYTLDRQWALRIADAIVIPGTIGSRRSNEPETAASAEAFRGIDAAGKVEVPSG